MMPNQISGYGNAAALAEIQRRNFDEAEARLREKMKPAQLAPLNFTQVAGDAASDAVIEEIRRPIHDSRFPESRPSA